MQDLKTLLEKKIKGAKRIAVLGIGSDLRGDDIAGIAVAEQLTDLTRDNENFKVFLGGTAPENLTSEIKKFQPEYLIIVDSADTGNKPGAVSILEPGQIGGISFSTHSLPLKVMIEYLKEYIKGEVIIIGIQPKTLTFGSPPSQEAIRSVKEISDTIKEII